jgi:hypothetical protein
MIKNNIMSVPYSPVRVNKNNIQRITKPIKIKILYGSRILNLNINNDIKILRSKSKLL